MLAVLLCAALDLAKDKPQYIYQDGHLQEHRERLCTRFQYSGTPSTPARTITEHQRNSECDNQRIKLLPGQVFYGIHREIRENAYQLIPRWNGDATQRRFFDATPHQEKHSE